MFLWGHRFCRVNPNSWSVTELRGKNQLPYFSQIHIKASNTLHLNPKLVNVRYVNTLMIFLPLPLMLQNLKTRGNISQSMPGKLSGFRNPTDLHISP